MRESEANEALGHDDEKESKLRVAKVLNNIGCVNFEQEKYSIAKEAFQDAIAIQKVALGSAFSFLVSEPTSKPGFLTMASTMCNLGYINLKEEKYHEAIDILNQSLKIQKTLLGPGNKLVMSTLDNLGYAHTSSRAYDKAHKVRDKAASRRIQTYSLHVC